MIGPRELPKIDIGGTMFYLDIRLNEFREVENFMNRISLDDIYETTTGYGICFDPLTRNFFKGNEQEYHERIDLKQVQLPTLEAMDPVGFKSLVDQWKDNNPIVSALIQSIPIVVEKDTKRLGELLRDHLQKPKLLEKKPRAKSKGKKI